MPKNTVGRAIDIMEYLKAQGFEKQVSSKDLFKAIDVCAGSRADTQKRYMTILNTFNLAKQVSAGMYELNWEEAGRLVFRR